MEEGLKNPARVGSVAAADPYSHDVAHRRLAFAFRCVSIVCIGLVGAVVVLATGLAELGPLKTTEYALVRSYGPDDRLYRIEPITQKVDGFELLLESQAQTYTKLVLEIDKPTQETRHRDAMLMTDGRFWKKLRHNRLQTKEMARALQDGLERKIHVLSANKVEGRESGYLMAVEFEQVDSRGEKEIGRKKLQAYLSMETRPGEVRETDRYINPLGIFVTDMVVKGRM